jgi:hypothetical protein
MITLFVLLSFLTSPAHAGPGAASVIVSKAPHHTRHSRLAYRFTYNDWRLYRDTYNDWRRWQNVPCGAPWIGVWLCS